MKALSWASVLVLAEDEGFALVRVEDEIIVDLGRGRMLEDAGRGRWELVSDNVSAVYAGPTDESTARALLKKLAGRT